MLGIKLGYYSDNPDVVYKIDSLCDFAEDLQPKFDAYVLPFLNDGSFGD